MGGRWKKMFDYMGGCIGSDWIEFYGFIIFFFSFKSNSMGGPFLFEFHEWPLLFKNIQLFPENKQ